MNTLTAMTGRAHITISTSRNTVPALPVMRSLRNTVSSVSATPIAVAIRFIRTAIYMLLPVSAM